MNLHGWMGTVLLVLAVMLFSYLFGWHYSDVVAIFTRSIYVFMYWAFVSLFSFFYNGITSQTWKIFSANTDSNSRVFAAVCLGTAFIIGRPF